MNLLKLSNLPVPKSLILAFVYDLFLYRVQNTVFIGKLSTSQWCSLNNKINLLTICPRNLGPVYLVSSTEMGSILIGKVTNIFIYTSIYLSAPLKGSKYSPLNPKLHLVHPEREASTETSWFLYLWNLLKLNSSEYLLNFIVVRRGRVPKMSLIKFYSNKKRRGGNENG